METARMQTKTLDITVPHKLARAEARRRIDASIGKIRTQYAGSFGTIQDRWNGDRLDFTVSALGQQVGGWLDVSDQDVQIHVVLPWLLAQLAERLRPQIESEARRVLELPK